MNRHFPLPSPSLHSVHPKLLFLHSSACQQMTPPFPQLPKPITCRRSGLPPCLNHLSSIAESHWLYLQTCPEILIRLTPYTVSSGLQGIASVALCPHWSPSFKGSLSDFSEMSLSNFQPPEDFSSPPKQNTDSYPAPAYSRCLPAPAASSVIPLPHSHYSCHTCLLVVPTPQANPPVSSLCVWLPVFFSSQQASPPQIRW